VLYSFHWWLTMDAREIKSLEQARREFSTQHKCEVYLQRQRWPGGVKCPKCGTERHYWLKNQHLWECRACKYHFSVTAGTIFHRSKIKLPRWFVAIWLMSYSPKGVAAKQLERELGVCYETAWYMAKRIRRAMKHDIFEDELCGIVEVDASSIKADGGTGRFGTQNVLGMTQRRGAMKMEVIDALTRANIQRVCLKNFDRVEMVYSDATHSMGFLSKVAEHRTVAHYWRHTQGRTHTNYVESAWSLLKRGVYGIFHHMSAEYLQDYLDEFSFRYSHRREKGKLFDSVLACCED